MPAEDPTYRSPSGFPQKHLSREETEQLYRSALANIERQIMTEHINELLQDPYGDGMTEARWKKARLQEGLVQVEADFDAWKQQNPVAHDNPLMGHTGNAKTAQAA